MAAAPSEDTVFGLTTGRLAALCDGVLAISMTLLVLSFSDLQRTFGAATTPQAALEKLVALWPFVLAYVLSFLLVGVYWILHHIMFHYILRADRVLLWLNLMFLMSIAFVPFTTGLLAECIHHEFNLVVAAYGCAHILSGLWLAAIWGHATRNRRLTPADLDGALVRAMMRTVLLGPLCYALGIAVSFFSLAAALGLYMIVPLFYLVPTRVDHHWMFLGKPLGDAGSEEAPATPTPLRSLRVFR